jgi:hypothetical protein
MIINDLIGEFVSRATTEQTAALETACERALTLRTGVRCWRWFEADRACFEVAADPTVPFGLIYEHEHRPDNK